MNLLKINLMITLLITCMLFKHTICHSGETEVAGHQTKSKPLVQPKSSAQQEAARAEQLRKLEVQRRLFEEQHRLSEGSKPTAHQQEENAGSKPTAHHHEEFAGSKLTAQQQEELAEQQKILTEKNRRLAEASKPIDYEKLKVLKDGAKLDSKEECINQLRNYFQFVFNTSDPKECADFVVKFISINVMYRRVLSSIIQFKYDQVKYSDDYFKLLFENIKTGDMKNVSNFCSVYSNDATTCETSLSSIGYTKELEIKDIFQIAYYEKNTIDYKGDKYQEEFLNNNIVANISINGDAKGIELKPKEYCNKFSPTS